VNEELACIGNVLADSLNSEQTDQGNVAEGLFAIAHAIESLPRRLEDRLAHAICMGIRKGLFGAGADDGSSVLALTENLQGR
jgi:hypothetical protein